MKSKLSKCLKKYFNLTTEPFHPYNQTNSYKTKFKIQAEKNLREAYKSKFMGGRIKQSIDIENSKDLSYTPDYIDG